MCVSGHLDVVTFPLYLSLSNQQHLQKVATEPTPASFSSKGGAILAPGVVYHTGVSI